MSVQQLAAGIVSVVGPALVFAGAWWMFANYNDEEDAQGLKNAGRVVNARVVDDGVDKAMDRALASSSPRILVLGPSYANTNVAPVQLAKRLGVSRDDILLFSVPNSVGSHWYSILKYRLFEQGYRPQLILMVSGLQSVLLNTPLTESSWINLNVQLPPEGDPLVSKLATQDVSLWYARLREQRGKIRSEVLGALRERPAQTFLTGPQGGALQPAAVRGALGRVFDERKIDMSLFENAGLVAVDQNQEAERAYTSDMLPDPKDTFVGPITAMAREYGARIAWIRPPMSPDIPAHQADDVSDDVQDRLIDVIEAEGGNYVDMRAVPITAAMFRDIDHMNEEGARRFTASIADALLRVDAMAPVGGRGDMDIDVSFVGQGTPTALVAGDEVSITLKNGWDPTRGKPFVQLAADGQVQLLLDDKPVDLRLLVDNLWFFRRVLTLDPGTVLTIRAVEDAKLLGLGIGAGPRRELVLGTELGLDGVQTDLFRPVEIEGSRAVDDNVVPTYPKPPVKVPGANREVLPAWGWMASYDTSRWSFLSDEAVAGETAYGTRCSPLRIKENGKLLPMANVTCMEVKAYGWGRSCHTMERIFFSASDASDPERNGRTYRLALEPSRRCDAAFWLYPVDEMQVAFPQRRMDELGDKTARFFTLEGKYLNQRAATVNVVLQVDGKEVINSNVNGPQFKEGALQWELDAPVSRDSDVRMILKNKDHTFYLIQRAVLSDRPLTH